MEENLSTKECTKTASKYKVWKTVKREALTSHFVIFSLGLGKNAGKKLFHDSEPKILQVFEHIPTIRIYEESRGRCPKEVTQLY